MIEVPGAVMGYNELETPAPSLPPNVLLIVSVSYQKPLNEEHPGKSRGLFYALCIGDSATYVMWDGFDKDFEVTETRVTGTKATQPENMDADGLRNLPIMCNVLEWYAGKPNAQEWTIIADNFARIDPLLALVWGFPDGSVDQSCSRGHNFFRERAYEVGRMKNAFMKSLEHRILMGKFINSLLTDFQTME